MARFTAFAHMLKSLSIVRSGRFPDWLAREVWRDERLELSEIINSYGSSIGHGSPEFRSHTEHRRDLPGLQYARQGHHSRAVCSRWSEPPSLLDYLKNRECGAVPS